MYNFPDTETNMFQCGTWLLWAYVYNLKKYSGIKLRQIHSVHTLKLCIKKYIYRKQIQIPNFSFKFLEEPNVDTKIYHINSVVFFIENPFISKLLNNINFNSVDCSLLVLILKTLTNFSRLVFWYTLPY